MKRGRPSTYSSEYCQHLIDHMSLGWSFQSFAATIGCNRDTLYEWANKFPEFAEAKALGTTMAYSWWEKLGIDGAQGLVPRFNSRIWSLTMRNRFGWSNFGVIEKSREASEFSHVPPIKKNYGRKAKRDKTLPKRPIDPIRDWGFDPTNDPMKNQTPLELNFGEMPTIEEMSKINEEFFKQLSNSEPIEFGNNETTFSMDNP